MKSANHQRRGTPIADRLLASVEYDTNGGCWLWPYATGNYGYGVLYCDGRLQRAHRVAFTLWREPIPDGFCVCHRCDTPACFNPDHLFTGTQAQNLADMTAKGRRVEGRRACGEENASARLTTEQALAIRRTAATGASFTSIGRDFGVSRVTVAKIAKGHAWSHLDSGNPNITSRSA